MPIKEKIIFVWQDLSLEIMEARRNLLTRIAKRTLKINTVEEIILPDCKTHYVATVIKTVSGRTGT